MKDDLILIRCDKGEKQQTKREDDELKWLYTNMTDEEIADKLARISAAQATNTDQALERILAGQ